VPQTGRSRVLFSMVSFEFFIDIILFRPYYDPGVDRNEYQEYFLEGKGGRCVGLTTLPRSCADCHEIWEPQTPGYLMACRGLYRGYFILYIIRMPRTCFGYTGVHPQRGKILSYKMYGLKLILNYKIQVEFLR